MYVHIAHIQQKLQNDDSVQIMMTLVKFKYDWNYPIIILTIIQSIEHQINSHTASARNEYLECIRYRNISSMQWEF